MKHLFLGGYADGKWIEVPDGHNEWNVAEHTPVMAVVQKRAPLAASIKHQRYVAMPWGGKDIHGNVRMEHIFVPDGWSAHDTIQRLIGGYQP